MSIFDKQQEVLDIQLTSYGRNLLAKQIFKPSFYTFHDDDIVYDIKYTSGSEKQDEIFDRIYTNSIYLKPQTRYADAELNKSSLELDAVNYNLSAYPAGLPLGTSLIDSKYYPAWNLSFERGKIDSVDKFISTGSLVKIPQMNLKDVILDSTDEILLSLEELNALDTNDNFEVEIFLKSGESWEQLKFQKPTQYVIDNILYDESELPAIPQSEDTALITNYFDIFVDNEIVRTTEDGGLIINVPDKINPAPFKENC
jgi:hypothetical protein